MKEFVWTPCYWSKREEGALWSAHLTHRIFSDGSFCEPLSSRSRFFLYSLSARSGPRQKCLSGRRRGFSCLSFFAFVRRTAGQRVSLARSSLRFPESRLLDVLIRQWGERGPGRQGQRILFFTSQTSLSPPQLSLLPDRLFFFSAPPAARGSSSFWSESWVVGRERVQGERGGSVTQHAVTISPDGRTDGRRERMQQEADKDVVSLPAIPFLIASQKTKVTAAVCLHAARNH